MEKEDKCLHKFRSVYYGSEWDVECEKCEKNIYDLVEIETASRFIATMENENKAEAKQTKTSTKFWIWASFYTYVGLWYIVFRYDSLENNEEMVQFICTHILLYFVVSWGFDVFEIAFKMPHHYLLKSLKQFNKFLDEKF